MPLSVNIFVTHIFELWNEYHAYIKFREFQFIIFSVKLKFSESKWMALLTSVTGLIHKVLIMCSKYNCDLEIDSVVKQCKYSIVTKLFTFWSYCILEFDRTVAPENCPPPSLTVLVTTVGWSMTPFLIQLFTFFITWLTPLSWRRMQQVSTKCWYCYIRLHDITSWKKATLIVSVLTTPNFKIHTTENE
jgi:hypothetical protein